jgi:hypothetical protein
MEDAKRLFSGKDGECWHLPAGAGSPHGNGYYTLTVSGKRWYAHRLSYTLFVGPIPADLALDHLCHTRDLSCPGGDACPHRQCVNPAHLEAVTDRVNSLRGRSPIAANAAKTVCAEGHPLVLKGSRRPSRYCPICRMRNRIAKGETSGNGHMRERTECPAGHPYDEVNTYIHRNPDGTPRCRMCRACMRERARARKAAQRQATS